MNRFAILSVVSVLAPVTTLFAQTTSTNVITSCVSKLSGVSRIVAAPTACNGAVENVVMWNQQGQAGPQGAPGLTYRGAFNINTFPYNKNDVVTYQGSTYIALRTAGGFAPNNPDFNGGTNPEWSLLVPQGATGAQGPQGIQGIPEKMDRTGQTGLLAHKARSAHPQSSA